MATRSGPYKRKILQEFCFGNVFPSTEISLRIERSLPIATHSLSELPEEKISLPLLKNQDALSALAKELNPFIEKTTIARDKIIGIPGFVDMAQFRLGAARGCSNVMVIPVAMET